MGMITQEEKSKREKNELKKAHISKLIELYNLYFEKAKDDSSVFSAFNNVSKELFADAEDSDIMKILNSTKDSDFYE